MKKAFITVCLAALALPSMADEESLVINMADGSAQQTFALADMGKLVFNENGFTVNAGIETASFNYDAVKSIKFAGLSTGIGTVTSEENSLKPYYSNGCLGIAGWPQERKARAAVYSIDGTTVITVNNWDGTPIPVSGLTRGIYIFKVDNNNLKFIKQ